MNRNLCLLAVFVVAARANAQIAGGSAYGRQGGREGAEAAERAKRTSEGPGTFIEASVLLNVKADEYVAVFGVAEEAPTVTESRKKVDQTIKNLSDRLAKLGVASKDIAVDFVVQARVYGFSVEGDLAREVLRGYEMKKTVSVRFVNRALLEQALIAAGEAEVYDLIKVDYVVKDTKAMQDRLMAAATAIVKRKVAAHAKTLELSVKPTEVAAERYSTYLPTDLYDSYVAAESEDVQSSYYRQNRVVQTARKPRTFYFNALSGRTFDQVINPVVIEPMVQFSLYLKVRVEPTAKPKPKPKPKVK